MKCKQQQSLNLAELINIDQPAIGIVVRNN